MVWLMRHRTFFMAILLLFPLALFPPPTAKGESVCFGTPGKGRLDGGVELPFSGDNFIGYSYLGRMLGRTYVHDTVSRVVTGAYERLAVSRPDTIYMYGETGKKKGGPFKPHKTHQNGLSVDFMTPILDGRGKSVPLPTGPFNKFGYAIEFDAWGHFGKHRIDFEALAAHLIALHEEAGEAGIRIRWVIFDPDLQPFLFETVDGEDLKNRLSFSRKRSWVRHDEHYHIDFELDCKPLP